MLLTCIWYRHTCIPPRYLHRVPTPDSPYMWKVIVSPKNQKLLTPFLFRLEMYHTVLLAIYVLLGLLLKIACFPRAHISCQGASLPISMSVLSHSFCHLPHCFPLSHHFILPWRSSSSISSRIPFLTPVDFVCHTFMLL